MDCSVRQTQDGTFTVVFSGGTLVDHGTAYKLQAIPSLTDPGRTAVAYRKNFQNLYTDVTRVIHGGRLGGLITARDIDAEEARITLDKIAFGMINRTNEINKTGIDAGGATNHTIFRGTKASDISIDPVLRTNISYICDTRDGAHPGDIAKIQAALQGILQFSGIQSTPFTSINNAGFVIDPTVSIGSMRAAGAFKTSPGVVTAGTMAGDITISTGGNAITVNWDDSTTINQVVDQINTGGGGAVFATYDKTNYKLFIYSDAPCIVFDNVGNLAKALALSAVVTSSAPVNNAPISGVNKAVSGQALNSATNKLNLYTNPFPPLVPVANYSTKFDTATVNWQPVSTISAVLFNITASTSMATGGKIYQSFNSLQQVVTLVKSGDQAFNAGILSAATPLSSIQITDNTGNLSRIFNFDTNENSSRLMDTLTTALASRAASETVLKTQAQAMVDQTQTLQDQTSLVSLEGELAQARVFQRSFEASVRLQAIIDEMLNTLINHMGSSTVSSSTPF
jgi:flagellar hook-associated protein FlgK